MNDKRKAYQQDYREKYKSQAKRVNITLTNSEYRKFNVAKADNEKVTAFVKNLALSALENQSHIPNDLKEELNTLRFAIRNIANNVNQIAHYSNTVRNMTISDENNILQHLKQLEDVIKEYTHGRLTKEKHDN
ncbi:MAG: plasmid mobilization relaxosome protein MobC [Gammaproteobacteria bacterium]|nr:plasmid mobilization relaxosome protein MobC [Gammaproteobacteria bacterium]